MNNNCTKKITKEDKKYFKPFVMIALGYLSVAVILGVIYLFIKPYIDNSLPDMLLNILKIVSPFANISMFIFLMIFSKIAYAASLKEYELYKENPEDEYRLSNIENRLSYVLLLISVAMILCFLFQGISYHYRDIHNSVGLFEDIRSLSIILGFPICYIYSLHLKRKIINFAKQITPTLKGSVYDPKFSEKWFKSCDEGIKVGIYKCCLKSNNSVSTACIILWLFCVIANDLWNVGVMPLVVVTIIWLVQSISYSLEAIRQGKYL